MTQDSAKHNYAVIMAGGSGTRLWPLSRKDLPKQMQTFISHKTLINETVDRLAGFIDENHIYVTTTTNYAARIKTLLPQIPESNIVIEPIARGTTAALALVTSTIDERDPKASIFYLASDHSVTDIAAFQQTLHDAFVYIDDHPKEIALVGIKPTRPDTGLGYIKMRQLLQTDPIVYSVDKFVEKPGLEVAQKYLDSGEYYWNAAYYCFKTATLLKAYAEADPVITDSINSYLKSKDIEDFNRIPDKVHEIEIIDPTKYPMVLIPADFAWSDIGNWRTLHEVLAQLEGNTIVSHAPQHIDINSQDCLVFSTDEKLIATIGLTNITIVHTPDALLVLDKEHSQEIKQLLEKIKETGRTEYL